MPEKSNHNQNLIIKTTVRLGPITLPTMHHTHLAIEVYILTDTGENVQKWTRVFSTQL